MLAEPIRPPLINFTNWQNKQYFAYRSHSPLDPCRDKTVDEAGRVDERDAAHVIVCGSHVETPVSGRSHGACLLPSDSPPLPTVHSPASSSGGRRRRGWRSAARGHLGWRVARVVAIRLPQNGPIASPEDFARWITMLALSPSRSCVISHETRLPKVGRLTLAFDFMSVAAPILEMSNASCTRHRCANRSAF